MGQKLYYAAVLAERQDRSTWKWRTARWRWMWTGSHCILNLYRLTVKDTGYPLAFCQTIQNAIEWSLGFEAGFNYAAQVGS